jgi:hypothetical protein
MTVLLITALAGRERVGQTLGARHEQLRRLRCFANGYGPGPTTAPLSRFPRDAPI